MLLPNCSTEGLDQEFVILHDHAKKNSISGVTLRHLTSPDSLLNSPTPPHTPHPALRSSIHTNLAAAELLSLAAVVEYEPDAAQFLPCMLVDFFPMEAHNLVQTSVPLPPNLTAYIHCECNMEAAAQRLGNGPARLPSLWDPSFPEHRTHPSPN